MSAYLEKASTAQLTRINAANRLFSVSLTRITSVPECAVSSVGLLWGSPPCRGVVGFLWGLAGALTGLADPARVPKSRRLPDPNDHFPVTQCHQGDLADCSDSAPIAGYGPSAPLGAGRVPGARSLCSAHAG